MAKIYLITNLAVFGKACALNDLVMTSLLDIYPKGARGKRVGSLIKQTTGCYAFSDDFPKKIADRLRGDYAVISLENSLDAIGMNIKKKTVHRDGSLSIIIEK